jgi:hypothetical protein
MSVLYPEGNAVIDRGRRLFQLRQTPGFVDLYKLSEALVPHAIDAVVDFPGWDEQQISALKARAQAAKEFHNTLFGEIDKAVVDANEEHEAELVRKAAERDTQTVAEEADQLRNETFKKFEDMEREFAGTSVSMG